MIKVYGGKCVGSISGHTDYLIIGYKLDDGREVNQGGKFRSAKAKGTDILNEPAFEKLMKDLLNNPDFVLSKKSSLMDEPAKKDEKEGGDKDMTEEDSKLFNQTMWTDRYKPTTFDDLVGN